MPSSLGIPGWFIALFVIMLLIGIGTAIWRVTTARQIAKDAGLDPNTATRMTLLSKDGIDATYLASAISSRQQQSHPNQPAAKTASERLQELQALKDKGLVTDDEYTARRQRILDSI
jgi:hypothetical protein